MWTEMAHSVERDGARTVRGPRSLLDRIGWKGLLAVGWRSTPLPLRPVALPYTLIVYRKLLASSYSWRHLLVLHTEKYHSSLLFRALRPRFRRIHPVLESYAIRSEGAATPLGITETDESMAELLSLSPMTPRMLVVSRIAMAD